MRHMMRIPLFVAVAVLFIWQASCQTDASKALALPAGQADDGREAFVRLQCNRCHSTPDIAWIGVELEGDVHVKITAASKPASREELITSITNPSYKISKRHILAMTTKDWESRMLPYAEVMTVQELCDIIAYLDEIWSTPK